MLLRLLFFACLIHSGFSVYKNTIVHFDLKGAPPKLAYFKELLTTVSDLGANGVLIEWEDMFPYTGVLESIINGNAYTEDEVISILEHASNLGLEVIPLVQTLAHMEWVLKTEQFAHLREDPSYPMVACIGDGRAVDLILESANQVISMHARYSMRYVHIGADEAFQIGICPADREVLPLKYDNSTLKLVFDHLSTVANNITRQFPGIKVLTWYDEFKTAPPSLVSKYYLDTLVTPVVWKYTNKLDEDLPEEMWRNLSLSFREVFAGSAFKGADGANRIGNRMKPYLVNNQQWVQMNDKYSDFFENFNSIILTGWQRYDHFSSLCELWPTSMVSLALNLIVATKYRLDEESVSAAIKTLKCPVSTTIDDLLNNSDKCKFPGYRVRDTLREFMKVKQFYENSSWVHNRENGWLQNSHMVLNISNPYYLDAIGGAYNRTLKKVDVLQKSMRSQMNELFFEDVAEEFITDYVLPFTEDLKKRSEAVTRIKTRSTYLPRPFFVTNDTRSRLRKSVRKRQ